MAAKYRKKTNYLYRNVPYNKVKEHEADGWVVIEKKRGFAIMGWK